MKKSLLGFSFGALLLGSIVVTGCGSSTQAAPQSPQAPTLTTFVMIPNQNNATVSIRTLDVPSGNTVHLSSVATGNNPFMVRSHPNQNFFYVANQGSSNLSSFVLNAQNGTASPVGANVAAPPSVSSVMVHPSGRFVYAAGTLEIRGYEIQNDGSLALIPASTVALTSPANLDGAFSNNGAHLHIPLDNSLQTFSIDAVTGVLTATVNIPVVADELLQVKSVPNTNVILASAKRPGPDAILPFSVSVNGVPSPEAGQDLGHEVAEIDVSRNGQLYTGVVGGGQIFAFNVGGKGVLTPFANSPFTATGGGQFLRLDPSNIVVLSHVGSSLASNLRLEGGDLTPAAESPFVDNLSEPRFLDFLQFAQ